MKRMKQNSNLFDAGPSLVKEWHPSSNGNLTPRSVKFSYPEKVWWLCSKGHEWQATIRYRLKQNDCPLCEKEAANKKVDLSIDLPSVGKNYRYSRRFKTEVTAVIEVPESGHWVYAEMTDFSKNGLCFKTEAAIRPGTHIKVKFDRSVVSSRFDESFKSSFNNGYQTYNSIVKWCRPNDDEQSFSNFEIGVERY